VDRAIKYHSVRGGIISLSDIYRKVRPACVAISLEINKGGSLNFISFGSGVCVDKSGIIITAKHVITGYYEDIKGEKTSSDTAPSEPEFLVIFTRMGETKYEAFYARPIAIMFAENDVAIMKIPEIPGGWPSITIPTSWTTREGDQVATSGFPLRGWHDTTIVPNLFSGIVSQINAEYIEQKKGWKINKLILDISIHPGNSGGPVFDANTGELIGIVSAQRLRSFNLSETITKLLAEVKQSYVNVWTNIVECVPWTSFVSGITEIGKRIKV
jgi:serine protease Do